MHNISHQLISLGKRLKDSKLINKELIDKLCKTAFFLNKILGLIDNSDKEGEELMKQINDISFESLLETTLVNKEVKSSFFFKIYFI